MGEGENNLGKNTEGVGEPELTSEAWENVDPEKRKIRLRGKKEKLQDALNKDPSDEWAANELQVVTEQLDNLENPLGSSY